MPIRFFLNDPKIRIQRGALIEKDKEKKTIGEFIKEVFPDLFSTNPQSVNLLKKTKVMKKNKKIKDQCLNFSVVLMSWNRIEF